MTAFKILGNWLDESGWTSVMAVGGVTSTGVADSFIKASHEQEDPTRLQQRVFTSCKYKEALDNSVESLGFKDWEKKMST